MQTSIEIIEEIKSDAARLQRKFLALPAPGENVNKNQMRAIDKAQIGLSIWRSRRLETLEKIFTRTS